MDPPMTLPTQTQKIVLIICPLVLLLFSQTWDKWGLQVVYLLCWSNFTSLQTLLTQWILLNHICPQILPPLGIVDGLPLLSPGFPLLTHIYSVYFFKLIV